MLNTRQVVRFAGMAAAIAVFMPTLAGCGDRSEASQASHDANLAIGAMSGGSGAAADHLTTIERFQDANTALSQSGLDGTLSEKAGAVIMSSWAELGLASGDDIYINDLEIELSARAAAIRTELRSWEAYNARAAAEEAYDPAPEVATLDRDRVEIETRMEAARNAKNSVDERISTLESQIDTLADQARSEREQAAKLELQAARLSAVAAAQLAPQIQQHALSAEKKLLDIARLEAKAHQLQTEATEATLNFNMFNEQKSLNEEARADILKARDEARAEAASLRAKASETASTIRTLSDQLLAFREGKGADESINELYSTQIGRLQSALSSARQGSSDMKSEARIAAGSANAALADALGKKARSYSDLAALFSRLADATPALPDNDWYATQASNASGVANTAATESVESYQSAASEFQGVRASGEAGDLLAMLVEHLNARAGANSTNSSDDPNLVPSD